MIDKPHTFSVTDWFNCDDGYTLTFRPSTDATTLLTAMIDDTPNGERIRLTAAQVASLAVELTRAVRLQPPIELENLARKVPAPAEATTMAATPDPRDELLRRAMTVLWEMPNSVATENARLRLAVEIAAHLLGLPWEAR